jgi:amino acid transporter
MGDGSEDTGGSSSIPVSARVGSQGRFRKVLSLHELLFLSLGASIGSAWLFGSVYGAAEAGPASIASWLIGGFFALVIAVTWAEIGGLFPSSGAVVRIPQYVHGYFAGFYLGWAYYLSAVIVPPVEAIAIVTYASAYVPALTSAGVLTPEGYVVSVAILFLTFALNSFGVKLFARFNTGVTWWKLLVPTVTALTALLYLYPPNFSSFGGFAPRGVSPIFSAVGTAGIIFAYTGFRAAMDYSGEARDPRRDVPRAMVLSVLITIALYTALEVAFVGGIRWGTSGLAPGDWSGLSTAGVYSSAPFYNLIKVLGIAVLASLLLLDAVVSPLGTVGVYVGSSARDLYALAEAGHISKRVSEVDKRYGVPRAALLVSLAAGVVFIFAFPNWGELASFGTAATVFTYLAGPTCLVVLRRRAPELRRSFRVPSVRLVAPVSFVMSSLVVYWTTWPYTGYSLAAFILGLAVFMLSRPKGSYRQGEVKRGLWIVVYSVVLTTVSYLGSYGVGLIPFPLDFGVVAVIALACFYWGARSGFMTRELSGLVEQEKVEHALSAPPARDGGG